jgi:hypothetical protein
MPCTQIGIFRVPTQKCAVFVAVSVHSLMARSPLLKMVLSLLSVSGTWADREQDFDARLINLTDAYVRLATKHSALIGLMFAAKHQNGGTRLWANLQIRNLLQTWRRPGLGLRQFGQKRSISQKLAFISVWALWRSPRFRGS